jgi:hypothetical protein
VLGLTVAEAQVLAEAHAAVDAAERRAQMAAIRAAVWAEAEEFRRLSAAEAPEGPGTRGDWLEGWGNEGRDGG